MLEVPDRSPASAPCRRCRWCGRRRCRGACASRAASRWPRVSSRWRSSTVRSCRSRRAAGRARGARCASTWPEVEASLVTGPLTHDGDQLTSPAPEPPNAIGGCALGGRSDRERRRPGRGGTGGGRHTQEGQREDAGNDSAHGSNDSAAFPVVRAPLRVLAERAGGHDDVSTSLQHRDLRSAGNSRAELARRQQPDIADPRLPRCAGAAGVRSARAASGRAAGTCAARPGTGDPALVRSRSCRRGSTRRPVPLRSEVADVLDHRVAQDRVEARVSERQLPRVRLDYATSGYAALNARPSCRPTAVRCPAGQPSSMKFAVANTRPSPGAPPLRRRRGRSTPPWAGRPGRTVRASGRYWREMAIATREARIACSIGRSIRPRRGWVGRAAESVETTDVTSCDVARPDAEHARKCRIACQADDRTLRRARRDDRLATGTARTSPVGRRGLEALRRAQGTAEAIAQPLRRGRRRRRLRWPAPTRGSGPAAPSRRRRGRWPRAPSRPVPDADARLPFVRIGRQVAADPEGELAIGLVGAGCGEKNSTSFSRCGVAHHGQYRKVASTSRSQSDRAARP